MSSVSERPRERQRAGSVRVATVVDSPGASLKTASAADPKAGRRILVMTVVHHPRDSRIWFRQIGALLDHGWDVTFVAPFSGYEVPAPAERERSTAGGALHCVDVPRAHGRHRLHAAQLARRILRTEAPSHDLVLVHDPELVLAAAGLGLGHLVWDVHEDAAAALRVKTWMPRPLRPGVARLWLAVERLVERRHRLLLAEWAYQDRFARHHPVVPNTVTVPPTLAQPGTDRVVYLGSLTTSRGSRTMIEVGHELRRRTGGSVGLEIIGDAPERSTAGELRQAHDRGDLVWHGFLPSDDALSKVRGALAGLCLLDDLPNFRASMPTKVIEYCALGLPVITTPLPLAVDLVRDSGVGVVVPWQDAKAVVDAVLSLREDPERVRSMGRNGYHEARRNFDWRIWSEVFVSELASMAHSIAQR